MEKKSLVEALAQVYDDLNPHHPDSVDAAKWFEKMLKIAPLSAADIALLKNQLQKKIAETAERNGAFSSRLEQVLESTLKMLSSKRPAHA
jgi:hypothetical protein